VQPAGSVEGTRGKEEQCLQSGELTGLDWTWTGLAGLIMLFTVHPLLSLFTVTV
jgi:hypothetical protein